MTPPSTTSARASSAETFIRHDLRPGDLGAVVSLHGRLYAAEHGFDRTFEAYVAGPLAEFVLHRTERDRLWLAERDGQLVGSIAIVAATPGEAQLRWFLVDPSARGLGLGTQLIVEAVGFAEACHYDSIFLWTVSRLTAASRLYHAAGFAKVEESRGRRWGADVVEEKYVLRLANRRYSHGPS